MDGLFEANRLVEVSMTKLGCLHKGGELPLRKTLMISKVLNKAQNIATSAHYTLLHLSSSQTPTRRNTSSKLLASITKKVETSCFEDDRLPQPVPAASVRTMPKVSARELSPIVSTSNIISRAAESSSFEEETMDFESVNSVLSNILSDSDTSSQHNHGHHHNLNKTRTSPLTEAPTPHLRPSRFLSDLSNSTSGGDWSAWRFDMNTEFDNTWRWTSAGAAEEERSPPLSPGKRVHKEAFPHEEKENSLLSDGLLYEDTKRFKSAPPEGCPLESLPGFCGYLSPRNLQSAPLITYMFGKGFTEPSNPSSSDWPSSFSPRSAEKEQTQPRKMAAEGEEDAPVYHPDNHFTAHFQPPAVKFSPILAF